ncbi:hypothetical protein HBB16_19785 [Pseudonocardia sp. MCCB 268]|nr:hypothetical protein [Pseudonocardia cytotoxica]
MALNGEFPADADGGAGRQRLRRVSRPGPAPGSWRRPSRSCRLSGTVAGPPAGPPSDAQRCLPDRSLARMMSRGVRAVDGRGGGVPCTRRAWPGRPLGLTADQTHVPGDRGRRRRDHHCESAARSASRSPSWRERVGGWGLVREHLSEPG